MNVSIKLYNIECNYILNKIYSLNKTLKVSLEIALTYYCHEIILDQIKNY